MAENMQYSFCPECGALMSGSVCATCGATLQQENFFEDFQPQSGCKNENVVYDSQTKVHSEKYNQKKKGHIPIVVWFLAAFIGLLFVLMIIFVIVAVVFILFSVNSFGYSTGTAATPVSPQTVVSSEVEDESDETSEDDSLLADPYSIEVSKLEGVKYIDVSGADIQGYFDNADLFVDEKQNPLEMNISYFDIFPYAHVNVPREDIMDLYYSIWGDSFDYSCGYTVEGHSIQYFNEENNVSNSAYIGYYQLVGDNIPNLDELNSKMFEQAVNPLIAHLEGKSKYSTQEDLSLYVEPFVTYNDEKKMSVIYLVYAYFDSYQEQIYLVSQNIDLEKGCFLSTSDLIQLDDSFASEFCERSEKQNGSYVEALEVLSDSELVDYLMDDETNILFFSPCGLEIGINYLQGSYNWGWVTVTLREMSEVLVNDSYDYLKPAKSTWAAPNGEAYDFQKAIEEYNNFIEEKYNVDEDLEQEYDDEFVLPPDQTETGDL